MGKKYYAYILRCADNSLYSGYTTDPIKRCKTHNERKGAKYTRTRLPVEIVYLEEFTTKSEALKKEYELKTYTHKAKEEIIVHFQNRTELIKESLTILS